MKISQYNLFIYFILFIFIIIYLFILSFTFIDLEPINEFLGNFQNRYLIYSYIS